ncbi:MAG: ATP-dependent zinc metalloprotease FtsH [Clostridia bacterium]
MEEKIKQNKKPNLIRNIIITAVVIVLLCVSFWFISSNGNGEKISYNIFIKNLQSGNVDKVQLNSDKIIITYKNGQACWFYSRNSIEFDVLEQVSKYNNPVNPDGSPAEKPVSTVQIIPGTTKMFSILNLLYPLLIIGSTVLLVVFVSKQIKGANKSSFDFVKNRARIATSKIKFDSVAGADEEKQEVAEIIEFLKTPEKFTEIGAHVPKGILLVGPPGTGKTLLAKAIAGEADVPFFTISGSDFMELFVGVGASRVRDLFENAKKAKPCIIFIDEIDAIGRQRGTGMGGGNDEREQTLNQLLVQMDGFEPNEGVVIIAATNRVDILDPALLRPGRFDRQVYVPIPDVKGREEILKVHAKNKKIDKLVDMKQVARITSGFTGADIENLLNESAINAVRDNRKSVCMNDINDAIGKITMGPQKKSRIITDRDKNITAIHEAGHALVCKLVKNADPVHEVSIIPRGNAAGYTVMRPDTDDSHITKSKLMDQISILLGGRLAESIFLSDVSTGASSDLQRASEIARNMVTEWGMSDELGLVHMGEQSELFLGKDYQSRVTYSERNAAIIDVEIKKIIDKAAEKTKKIINDNKEKLEVMVKVLLEKETIYSDEVDLILEGKSSDEVESFIDNKNKKDAQSKDAQVTNDTKSKDDTDKIVETKQDETITDVKSSENKENKPLENKVKKESKE